MKKIIKAVISICVIIALIAVYANAVDTVNARFSVSALTNKEYHLTAHRGLSSVAPENTAAALEQAGKAGYYAAEFDIVPTSDGVWVLMHDDTVDRMTDGEGEVSSFTYEEISKLRIDKGNGIKNYPDEKIITLEDAIAICRRYSMRPMIEVKGGEPEDMRGLLNVIRMSGNEDILIIDFNSDRIKELRRLDPEIELWYLVSKGDESTVEFAKNNNLAIAFNHKKLVNYRMIKTAKQEGITLAAWTVDFLPLMDILTFLGVNYITTNRIIP
ncbi:MAG: hypothetical protein IKW12_02380 [Clostridia bacterium]|nr:hypothetical protein [Clostridia bacterium]